MKQIVLIDGKWCAYRHHFAHKNLRSHGKPTGMFYGFLTELLKINKKLPQARIVICWDGEKRTWRHKAYSAYKANRAFNPEYEKMQWQTHQLIPILRSLGLWVLQIDEVEADDMIGMTANLLARHGHEVRIFSKDRDLFQLLDSNVWAWQDLDLAPLKIKDVERWLGAPMSAFLEIRAMAGDPGDGLKGLPGVGLKTAVKLWNKMFDPKSRIEVLDKYKEHWSRIEKEKRMARIITNPRSKVWSDETCMILVELLKKVATRPERDGEWGERHRREIYQFLGQYELKELLAERQKLFRLP
jgi:DNA polymerase I